MGVKCNYPYKLRGLNVQHSRPFTHQSSSLEEEPCPLGSCVEIDEGFNLSGSALTFHNFGVAIFELLTPFLWCRNLNREFLRCVATMSWCELFIETETQAFLPSFLHLLPRQFLGSTG
jgi:hypothetical protein